jgi:hypothetical protein
VPHAEALTNGNGVKEPSRQDARSGLLIEGGLSDILESRRMSPCPSSGLSLVHRNDGSLTFKQVLEAWNGAAPVSM